MAKAGDTVSIVMERDTDERVVEAPAALAQALRENKKAKALWDKLAYTHRKEFARWISDAKQEETRGRRAAKAVTMILAKKTMS